MSLALEGKKAVVTGAGSGLGAAIAQELGRAGAAVACLDLSLERAHAVTGELRQQGVEAIALESDVADRAAVERSVAAVYQRFERVDILVNNAGHPQYIPFVDIDEAAWDRMIDVHLKGTFNCTRAVVDGMLEQCAGRVVNMASVAGVTGTPLHTHYSAAKGGIIGFTKALARELSPKGITLNAIAPGFIDTPLTRDPSFPPELREMVLSRTPVGRAGTPEDIAYLAAFLASDRSSFITGEVLSSNGGYVM
jgi:NAD(P)-dependent dehydrogenase (short-subunit alcohol dehydrogenase family)